MATKVLNKDDLSFLKSIELSKTIEDSIQYIQIIFEESDKKESDLYKEETYRVILLYVISIIEAILIRILELRKEQITAIDYKYVSPINEKIKHTELPKGKVVMAVQEKNKKDDRRIGLVELIDFVQKKGLMNKKIAEDILEINNIRNTFHFTKPRDKITCETKTVEKAFQLLVKIIEGGSPAIKFKK